MRRVQRSFALFSYSKSPQVEHSASQVECDVIELNQPEAANEIFLRQKFSSCPIELKFEVRLILLMNSSTGTKMMRVKKCASNQVDWRA